MLAMIGPETLLPVALIVLVLFGGAKLPEFARSLGRAKKEFQKGVQEGHAEEPTSQPVEASASQPVEASASQPVEASASQPEDKAPSS